MPLASALEGSEWLVLEADTGEQALELAAANQPRTVIITGGLPDFEAIELCRRLRILPDTHSIPVLLVLPPDDPKLLDQALGAGADDYILTPVHLPTLILRTKRLIELAAQRLNAVFQAEILNHVGDPVLVIDPEYNIIYWSDDAERVFGIPRVEILGKSLYEAYQVIWDHPEDRDEALRILREQGTWHGENLIRMRDGSEAYFEANIRALGHPQQPTSILAILRDITERRRMQRELEENERALRETNYNIYAILQAIPLAFILIDHEGNVQMWNQAADELFGEYYAYLQPGELLNVYTSEQFKPLMERAAAGEVLNNFEMPFRRLNGEVRYLSISTAVLPAPTINGLEGIIAVVADITDRIAIETAEREQRVLAEALQDIASALARVRDLEGVMSLILEMVGRVVPHDAASIMLIEGDIARLRYMHGFPEGTLEKMRHWSLPLTADTLSTMLSTGKPYIIPDVTTTGKWVVVPELEWVRSYLGTPIRAHDRIIGFLNLDSGLPNAFTPKDAERLQAFADQAAIAIENAQLYETIRRDAEEMRTLHRATAFLFTSQLFASDDLADVAEQIVTSVTNEFGHIHCALYLLDEQKRALIRVAQAGNSVRETPPTVPLDSDTMIAEAARQRVTKQTDSATQLALPMTTLHGVIGVLNLQSMPPGAFDEQDIRILHSYGDRVAATIENIRLYHEIQRRVDERTAELSRIKERVEAILNNSSDGILMIYQDGTIQQTNRAFDEGFGYAPDEIYGQPVEILALPHHAALLSEMVQEVLQTDEGRRVEITARRKNGTFFDADVLLSPVREQRDQKPNSVVCSLRDITERKRMERDLRDALARAHEVNLMKTRFIARASHEFRTPLALINTATDMLQTYYDRLNAEQREERFARIREEIQHMTLILDDLLTISRGDELGESALHPTRVNLAALCTEAVDAVTPIGPEQRQIHLKLAESCGEVKLDPMLMRRTLINLLSNALKYSRPDQPVEFTVECDQTHLYFRIRDYGIGIPEKDQQHLFQAFHRGQNASETAGTGLGLAIVKQVIDLHGGTITVNSREGEGTLFTITLPKMT